LEDNMRPTQLLSAALVATAIVSGATAAHAEPVVSTSLGYLPTEGNLGDTLEISVSGCTLGGESYVGGYVEEIAPTMAPQYSADGSWSITVAFGAMSDAASSTVVAHIFCATGPVTSLDDPNLIWDSPGYQFTTLNPGGGASSMSTLRSLTTSKTIATTTTKATAKKTKKAKKTTKWHQKRHATKVTRKAPVLRTLSASGVSALLSSASEQPGTAGLVVDKNALPVVDHIGLSGARAAALKSDVDAQLESVGTVNRLVETYLGRPARSAELKTYVAQLQDGKKKADPESVAKDLANLKEFKADGHMTDAEFIDQLNRNAFGHVGPVAERNSLVAGIKAKTTSRDEIGAGIAQSAELRTAMADEDYITASYWQLVGRAPTAAEVATYTQLLEGTLSTRVQVVETIYVATH
jgi:hypothetical protein